MFATENITAGALLFTESPILVIHKPHHAVTVSDVKQALKRITKAQNEQIQHLRMNGNAALPYPSAREAFGANCFTCGGSSAGLFPIMSRFNHSCIGNAIVPPMQNEGDTITLFARLNIASGEEITFCYTAECFTMTAQQRNIINPFICDCEACRPSRFQRASDLRRCFLRGLQWLLFGRSFHGRNLPGEDGTIILDPTLRKAARERRIPLSSRFIYHLLILVLLEAEGLYDQFTEARFLRYNVFPLLSMFQTLENQIVVFDAMEKKSPLQKYKHAVKIFGLADKGDDLARQAMLTGKHPALQEPYQIEAL